MRKVVLLLLPAVALACSERSVPSALPYEPFDGEPVSVVTMRVLKVKIKTGVWKCVSEVGDSIKWNQALQRFEFNFQGSGGTSSDSLYLQKDSTGLGSPYRWQWVPSISSTPYYFGIAYQAGWNPQGVGYGNYMLRLDSIVGNQITWWTRKGDASTGTHSQMHFAVDNTGNVRFEDWNVSPTCAL